jgi:hypothetical protein
MIGMAFLIAALVLFILAAVGVTAGRLNLMAAGLACWMASLLVSRSI